MRPIHFIGCLLVGFGLGAVLADEPLHADALRTVDTVILEAIDQGKCPGGVFRVEQEGRWYQKAYGSRALVPEQEVMTVDTIFDLASLTKVVATTPSIMILVERGSVSLDAPVQQFVPEFRGEGRGAITVRHLLTHTSGLPPGISTRGSWAGSAAAIEKACAVKLRTQPGEAFKYSDVNFILLGEIVQRVSAKPLEVFVQENLYGPLQMVDTGYLPPAAKLPRIAPTEVVDGEPLLGIVHDPTARKMGGVAGHAGLFSTASDLSRYARMLLNLGELDGVRVFKPETVRLMTRVQTPPELSVKRGLGWDLDSGYSGPRGEIFPPGSYGHTGWTGTSMWMDPSSMGFVIFLSNRNHPTEDGSVIALRRRLGTLAAEAMGLTQSSEAPASESSVKSGNAP